MTNAMKKLWHILWMKYHADKSRRLAASGKTHRANLEAEKAEGHYVASIFA
jgi:hypothetical protein